MKRFALSLMALALTGAMAFAQDAPVAKVSGYVDSGLKIVNTSAGNTLQAYANDAGVAGYRAKVTGSIAGSNYGVTATFEKDATAATTIDGAYGWLSPMEGLKLEAGTTNSNPLGELDDNGKGYFGAAGAAAEFSTGGLTVGALLSPGVVASGALPYIIGARYALDKVVTVNLTAGNEGMSALNSLYATASVTAVTGLTLTAGYNSSSMATTASSFIDVKAGYAITDALSAGVVVYDYTTGTSYLTYKPYVSYALGGGLSTSAYLKGDTMSNPNYEVQGELDYVLGGAKIASQVMYDTNPGNLGSAVPAATVLVDFIFSF